MEPDDLIILDELRELTNIENAEEVIRQKDLAAERSRASAEVIGHDKQRGWRVRQIDGTEVNRPAIHTTGALGRGLRVDLNRGPTSAAIDTKPTGNSNLSSSTAASKSTGDSSTSSGFGGGSGQYWRADPDDQSCKPVSYTGNKRSGDFASENECLASLGLKNWKCINGACGVVAPGTGVWNSQQECEEKGRGPWGIRNGKCTILPPEEWCNDKGEARFQSQYECENTSRIETRVYTHNMASGPISVKVPGIIQSITTGGTWLNNPGNPPDQCSRTIGAQIPGGQKPSGVGSDTFYSDYDTPYSDNVGSCTYTITYKTVG